MSALLPSTGLAQNSEKLAEAADNETNPGFSAASVTLPESLAFSALNVDSNAVVRPKSPQVLATTLLNGIDAEGNFQTGFAVDLVPYILFGAEERPTGITMNPTQFEQSVGFRRRLLWSKARKKMMNRQGSALERSGQVFDKGDPRLDSKFRIVYWDCRKHSRLMSKLGKSKKSAEEALKYPGRRGK